MWEDKRQMDVKSKHRPAYLLLVVLLLSFVFSLTVSAGEEDGMPGQQPSTSASNSRSVKPSVSGTRVIPLAVTASRQSPGGEPEMTTDGEVTTVWNAGGGPPQWIQFDFGEPTTLSEILLNVEQTPEGHTIHKIFGGPSSDKLKLLGTLDGNTQSGQWLRLKTTANDVRYLKVRTTESPSSVAWREIEVYR